MKTFVKHVYDIDLVNIYNLLNNKLSNDTSEKGVAMKKDFLDRLGFSIKQIFQSNKENYNLKEEDYESLPSYVITPNNDFDNYIYWLGLFLLSNPNYKTNLILEYHYFRWANKMKFLNCVEFYILESVSNNDFIQDELVIKTLSEWILFKRLNNGYPSSNTDTSEDETRDKTKTKNKTKSNQNLVLINKSDYETKDLKFPEMGDESISSTEKKIFELKFSDKIVFDELLTFIKLYSNEVDDKKIKEALEFKSVKEKIIIHTKPKFFINIIKELENRHYLLGGNGIKKYFVHWIWECFTFSKECRFEHLYNLYIELNVKDLNEFEEPHKKLFSSIEKRLIESKKMVNHDKK